MEHRKPKLSMLLGVTAMMGAGAGAGTMPASAEAVEKDRLERRLPRRGYGPNSPPWTGYARTNSAWAGPHATAHESMPTWERGIVLAAIAKRARKVAQRNSALR